VIPSSTCRGPIDLASRRVRDEEVGVEEVGRRTRVIGRVLDVSKRNKVVCSHCAIKGFP